VPETVDAAVDLRALVNETAPLGQRHDFFHQRDFFGLAHTVSEREAKVGATRGSLKWKDGGWERRLDGEEWKGELQRRRLRRAEHRTSKGAGGRSWDPSTAGALRMRLG